MRLATIFFMASTAAALAGPTIQICTGEYALCAASTCTETGNTMIVAGNSFKEMACKCPILKGPAVADVTGGNMQGTCASPGEGKVWSLFSTRSHFRQEMNGWSRKPKATAASFQICGADLKQGAEFTNCFSFSCTKGPNGIAVCHCPKGENLSGQPVAADTAFGTAAGQGDSDYCFRHPVGGPMP